MTTAITKPPAAARKISGKTIVGRALLALWALVGLWLAYFIVSSFNLEMISKYGPRFANGVWTTVQIVSISLVLGAVLSLPVTAGRMSTNKAVGGLAFSYSYFFRGTPLLAQTFLVYYGAGQFRPFLQDINLWWFFRDAFNCVVFTFALNTAAYQAEILRGAINSVPKGQWEAAQALGLKTPVTFFKIILPQSLIIALRPYGNEIILMIKGSAIASVVTVLDIMGATRYAFSRTFDFQVYLWAAIMYLIIVEVLRRLWDLLEKRLTRHLKR